MDKNHILDMMYLLVSAMYDSFIPLLFSIVHSSYIAVTRSYVWFIAVIQHTRTIHTHTYIYMERVFAL